jgi:hypothetical protein
MRYAPFFPLALLLGCASTDRPVTEIPATTPAPTVNRVFDLPALLGMNANDIVQPLTGQPSQPNRDGTSQELSADGAEATHTYWRDTTALMVSYDPATLRVNNYFIKTKSGHTADYNALLKLANVSPYDKRMTIEPIASIDNPRLYMGVKVVPRL